MPSISTVESLIPKLRILYRNPSLNELNYNHQSANNCIKEFKKVLVTSIKNNSISDDAIVSAADCLYDVKAIDVAIGSKICNVVESRPSIYTKALKGGILWSFYLAATNNCRRKKVIKSSCSSTLDAFLDYLTDVRNEGNHVDKIEYHLRDLKIISKCYILPVATLARLEQSLLDARDVLSDCMKHSNLVCKYILALISLNVRNAKVIEDAVRWFIEAASHNNVLETAEITKVLLTLSECHVDAKDGSCRAIYYLVNELLRPPELLLKSPSALCKLYVASCRVSGRNKNLDKSRVSDDGVEYIAQVSNQLLVYCCRILDRFSAQNLLVLYNSLSHHVLRDREKSSFSVEIPSYIKLIDSEINSALMLDASIDRGKVGSTVSLYDRYDLLTIYRAAMRLSSFGELNDSSVAKMTARLLNERFSVDINKPDNNT